MILDSGAILDQLRRVLAEDFDIEPERVQERAHLYDDLDLDSIDAVDLIDRLREITGKPIAADQFREARTVEDVIAIVRRL